MAELYDSERVRYAARSIRGVAEELSEGTTGPQRRALQASEPLEGKAAEAIRERLLEMRDRSERLSGELNTLALELERYAQLLEDVSERLAQEMQ